jgi:hypothetical protein
MASFQASSEQYRFLADYVADARRLTVAAFRDRYGEAFLIHDAPLEKLKPSLRTKAASVALMFGDKTNPAMPVTKEQVVVFPVQSTGRSPFPNFVSIGRADNNDIIIGHESVSKFHAFFRHADDGSFVIQDGGSKNGTQLNYARVPDKNEAKAVTIASGARVSFGLVQMTFLLVDEFWAFAQGK